MDDGRSRVWCSICKLSLNSQTQADQHYSGRTHLNKLKRYTMDASDSANGHMSPIWCSVCNTSLESMDANEHFESRTHLNRCLQKGVGIVMPGTVGKDGERSSTWCSVCNHALGGVAEADEHYESRAHLNKCLQRGVGLPLTFANTVPHVPPASTPRFSQAGATNTHSSAGNYATGSTTFRPGIAGVLNKTRPPRSAFPQNTRPIGFGAKTFPIQPFIRGGQGQVNQRGMTNPYRGGYSGIGQQDVSANVDNFNQYDSNWQNASAVKNGWPYCETCDQVFPSVSALSQHCNSAGHMEMKMMKQGQYHPAPQPATDPNRFYQGASGGHMPRSGGGGPGQVQGQYYGNQTNAPQDIYRGGVGAGGIGQNQGGHYAAKEWRPFNRNGQFIS